MKNKRKSQRVSCLVPVEGQEGGVFDLSRTIDISSNGIGFVSSKRIPLNKKITIELDLNEADTPVLVTGKVSWVRPILKDRAYRIGLAFTDFKTGSKSRLSKFFKN